MVDGRSGRVRWPVVLVISAAVAVTISVTFLLATWPPSPPESQLPPPGAARGQATPSAGQPSTPVQETVAVALTDSFSAGTARGKGPRWPEIVGEAVGWDVVMDTAADGYVASGSGETFEERVDEVLDRSPGVILVAGGIRDLENEPAEVADAAEDVVARLADGAPDARIVLVSPFSSGDPGPLATALSYRLRGVAEDHGVRYVDATGFLRQDQGMTGPGAVHPTRAGHEEIARQMERRLVNLGIAEGP